MKVVVGDQTYDHDPNRFMSSEARAVKRATGMNPDEFNKGLAEDDPFAVAALVWVLRRRAGEPDLAFDDCDFNMSELSLVEDEPDPTPAGPASSGSPAAEPDEASPST